MQINAYLNEYEFWILNLKIEKTCNIGKHMLVKHVSLSKWCDAKRQVGVAREIESNSECLQGVAREDREKEQCMSLLASGGNQQ